MNQHPLPDEMSLEDLIAYIKATPITTLAERHGFKLACQFKMLAVNPGLFDIPTV